MLSEPGHGCLEMSAGRTVDPAPSPGTLATSIETSRGLRDVANQPDDAAKHARIAADLRTRIHSGELLDGDRLPGENVLMKEYGVARMTARQALAALQAEGLAVARKGVGVFVRAARPVSRFGSRRLSRDVWRAGRSMWDVDETQTPVSVDRLRVYELPAPDDVARLLDVPPGAPVVARDRRYVVAERPVQLATAFIPRDIAAGTPLVRPNTGPGGIYARLAELGHEPIRFTEELRVRMPTPQESQALELPPGTPVILVARTAFADGDRPVEASLMTLSADAYVLHYDFDA